MQIEIRGLERLSLRERQAVYLKETGHSTAAIAAQLGIGQATVAKLLARARAKGYEIVFVLPAEAMGIPEVGTGGDPGDPGELREPEEPDPPRQPRRLDEPSRPDEK